LTLQKGELDYFTAKHKAPENMMVKLHFKGTPITDEKNTKYVGLLTRKYFQLVQDEENVIAITRDLTNCYTTIRTIAFFNIVLLKEKLDNCLLNFEKLTEDQSSDFLFLLHKITRQLKVVPKRSEDKQTFGENFSGKEKKNVFSLEKIYVEFNKGIFDNNKNEVSKSIHFEKGYLL
jgi:hypothetical protein